VRLVHVAHIETGALARETTGTQSRETALDTDLRQGIGLVYELRELAAAEELLHRRDHRANIDQRVWRGLARLLDAHAFLDHALHAQQANAELCLDQLAHAAHTAVAQVVDVILAPMPIIQRDQATNNIHQVVLRQNARALRHREVQLAIEFIAAHAAKIVAARVEEHVLDQRASVIDRRGIAGTHLLVELQQRLVLPLDRIAVQCRLNRAHIGIVIHLAERVQNPLVAGEIELLAIPLLFRQAADRAQEGCHRQLALAIDLHTQQILIAGLEFQPGAASGDQLGREELAARGGILIGGKVDAGRTHELAHHHALGAAYDKRTFLRHQGEITHEDILLDDLARLFVRQTRLHSQRGGIRRIAVAALILAVPGFSERFWWYDKFQFQIFSGEIFNRRDFLKKFAQTLLLNHSKESSWI
jgi:hypothetical protein